MSRIAAVVLAAGAATRYGAPKQRELLPTVLERLGESPAVDEVVVVEGAYGLRDTVLQSQACDTVLQGRARVVHCAEWERGPGASLRCALGALGEEVEAAVVVLADGPRLSSAAVTRVVRSWQDDGGDLVAASYEGVRGHPLLVARAAFGDVPDEGMRAVSPRLVRCDDLGHPGDVDTPADLAG